MEAERKRKGGGSDGGGAQVTDDMTTAERLTASEKTKKDWNPRDMRCVKVEIILRLDVEQFEHVQDHRGPTGRRSESS